MKAEWDVNATAAFSREENLLNLCRQLEQAHVDWKNPCTYRGASVCIQWPAIGELGRYKVEGVEVQFIRTQNRQIKVLDAAGKVYEIVRVQAGMADRLYLVAKTILAAQSSVAA